MMGLLGVTGLLTRVKFSVSRAFLGLFLESLADKARRHAGYL